MEDSKITRFTDLEPNEKPPHPIADAISSNHSFARPVGNFFTVMIKSYGSEESRTEHSGRTNAEVNFVIAIVCRRIFF